MQRWPEFFVIYMFYLSIFSCLSSFNEITMDSGYQEMVYFQVKLHAYLFSVLFPITLSFNKRAKLWDKKKTTATIGDDSGCKENHFYSLPFGQAEASIY